MTTKSTPRLLRWIALASAIVLFAAGCGDDGDSGEATPADTDTTTPAGDDGDGSPDDGTESPDPSGSGSGGANVSLGTGEQFEFDQELVCIALGGAVSGTFRNDEGVEVSIDVPPEDWETSTTGDWDPPSLSLRDERDEMNWRIFEAGPQLEGVYPGTDVDQARITDFSVDGSSATGNGFVIDTFGVTRATAEGSETPQPVPVFFGFECS